jgi:drug/metabolite transporter (DMT)-like permease
MNPYIFSFVLLVLSAITYQISQKYVPDGLNPWHVFFWVYTLAAVLCLGFALSSGKSLLESFKASNWAVWLLGLAVIGIELGYLLAFRAGWRASTLGLTFNVTAALVMVPVGLLLFKEKITAFNLLGGLICVVGLVMLSRR